MYLLGNVNIRKEYDGTFTISIMASPDVDDTESIEIGITHSSLLYLSNSFRAQCSYNRSIREFDNFTFWFDDGLDRVYIRKLNDDEIAKVKAYCYLTAEIAGKIL